MQVEVWKFAFTSTAPVCPRSDIQIKMLIAHFQRWNHSWIRPGVQLKKTPINSAAIKNIKQSYAIAFAFSHRKYWSRFFVVYSYDRMSDCFWNRFLWWNSALKVEQRVSCGTSRFWWNEVEFGTTEWFFFIESGKALQVLFSKSFHYPCLQKLYKTSSMFQFPRRSFYGFSLFK